MAGGGARAPPARPTFVDLRLAARPAAIDAEWERGVTAGQLLAMVTHVSRACAAERWAGID
eukprot:2789449-Prymnesium_polylepis.1